MGDGIGSAITTAVGEYSTELMTVGAAGLALGVVIWGLPKAFGFFKKTAK